MDVDTYLLTNVGASASDPWKELRDLPENGPGFQFIEIPSEPAVVDEDEIPPGEYLVFNCELFVPIHGLDMSSLSMRFPAHPSYDAFIRSLKPKHKTRIRRPKAKPPVSRSALVISTFTTAGEIYWRLSAYPDDKRITPERGTVPGTYVTTNSDIEVVGSGFAAVGRYALPNPFPAVYAYAIRPNQGTVINLGAVKPNYDQAGGGVEGVFDNGTESWTVANYIRVLPAW